MSSISKNTHLISVAIIRYRTRSKPRNSTRAPPRSHTVDTTINPEWLDGELQSTPFPWCRTFNARWRRRPYAVGSMPQTHCTFHQIHLHCISMSQCSSTLDMSRYEHVVPILLLCMLSPLSNKLLLLYLWLSQSDLKPTVKWCQRIIFLSVWLVTTHCMVWHARSARIVA